MGEAYGYWRNYTEIMGELYKPTDMQRNKSFSSWHASDDDVLQEYHKLGSEGMPEWFKE